MTAGGPGDQPITGINVPPLVDITLVLLIIFMVTAKLIVKNQALTVELPKAATSETVQQIFTLIVTPDGNVSIDGRAIASDADLVHRARSAQAAHRELRAVIQAAGAVPHRRVMKILDLLRQAGVSRIGFGVVRDEPVPAAR
jgi:biopolymer transport protein TolR